MGKDLRKEERKRNWVHKKSHTLGLFLENFIKGGRGHLPPMFLGRDHQPLPRLSKELCLIKALWRVLEKQRRLGMTSISGFPVISSLPRSSLSSSLASLPPFPCSPLDSPNLSSLSLTRAPPISSVFVPWTVQWALAHCPLHLQQPDQETSCVSYGYMGGQEGVYATEPPDIVLSSPCSLAHGCLGSCKAQR